MVFLEGNGFLKDNTGEDPFCGLRLAIRTYDKGLALSTVKNLIIKNIDPSSIIKTMTDIMREIGEAYQRDEVFLPDLIGASDSMSSAMPLVEAEIKKRGWKINSLGVVVLGTVLGDIHSIGKQMVGTMLTAEGFIVNDIGIDVSADKFIDAIKAFKPDILAMSALLTTTAYEQKKVISLLKTVGLRDRLKIMVGGGAVDEEFALSIGADGYDPTAPGAAKLARRLIGK